jgi:hypothetical protein
MARRPASITQADVARAIRAAKQAGAAEVEVRIGDRDAIVIRITPSSSKGANVTTEESADNIVL